MKKTLFILTGIGLLCVLLIARLFTTQHDRMGAEREWFAKALRYEFSARIDSIRMLNVNTGRLWCTVTAGNPQPHREDSLKQLFKENDMLYLIFKHSGDSILFLFPDAKLLAKGDSVRISSATDSVVFFRNGKPISNAKLTTTIIGFGRPFFLKWD